MNGFAIGGGSGDGVRDDCRADPVRNGWAEGAGGGGGIPGRGVNVSGAAPATGEGAATSRRDGIGSGCAAGIWVGAPKSCSLLNPSGACACGNTAGAGLPAQLCTEVEPKGSNEPTGFTFITDPTDGSGSGAGVGAGVANPKLAFGFGWMGPELGVTPGMGCKGDVLPAAAAAAFAAAKGLVGCGWGTADTGGWITKGAGGGGCAANGAGISVDAGAGHDVDGNPWNTSLAGRLILSSLRAPDRTLRKPMSVVPSMSKPSSTCAFPAAI